MRKDQGKVLTSRNRKKWQTSLPVVAIALPLVCISGCGVLERGGDYEETPQLPAPRYSAEDEAEYRARFERLRATTRAGAGLNAYDPLEQVPGVDKPVALPRTPDGRHTIESSALTAATNYAAAANSSAFIVWRRGEIETAQYFGDTRWSTPIVSRSLAKPLSVLAAGRAIETGHIESLDQPVADFITEWRDTPKEKMLVRHLLDMRSGLLPQAAAPKPEDILNRAYLHPRHEDIIVHDYPLTHTPGTRYEYSNATSDLVALVIERATGKRYAEWISENVLRPIGAQGGTIWINRPGGLAHSGCCILLPAESWLRMAILLVQDGRWQETQLLPPGFVEEMRTPTPQNEHAGMGVYVAGRYVERRGAANPGVKRRRNYHSEPYAAADLFLFDGNGNQVIYIVPSQDLIIVRLGERPPQEPEWDNSYLPNTILRGIRPGPGDPQSVPQPLE